MALGTWIAQRRIERGLTQDDVATALGVKTKQSISAFETGRMGIPGEHYAALANLLQVPDKAFAKIVLRCHEPYLYGLLFGVDTRLRAELKRAQRGSKKAVKPKASQCCRRAARRGVEAAKEGEYPH